MPNRRMSLSASRLMACMERSKPESSDPGPLRYRSRKPWGCREWLPPRPAGQMPGRCSPRRYILWPQRWPLRSAGGERGSVRLSLNQLFSGKAHQYLAVRLRRRDKGIVLFRRNAGQPAETSVYNGWLPFQWPIPSSHGQSHLPSPVSVPCLPRWSASDPCILSWEGRACITESLKNIFAKNLGYIYIVAHSLFPFIRSGSTAIKGAFRGSVHNAFGRCRR